MQPRTVHSGNSDYTRILVPLIENLKQETVLTSTENGPHDSEILTYLTTAPSAMHADHQGRAFFSNVASHLEACLQAGGRCKLPSSKNQRMWSAFHKFWTKPEIMKAWSSYIAAIPEIPVSLHPHTTLALQFLVDRWFKSMITAMNKKPEKAGANKLSPLSTREQNVVFYMSGYMCQSS